MANLLSTVHTKFYQNRLGLVEDMTKHLGVFFGSRCISQNSYRWRPNSQDPIALDDVNQHNNNSNKSAQSNLGRGPRRGAVAHIRRNVPIGYNGAPQIRPQVPLPVNRSSNPATCLMPGPVQPTMPNGIRIRSAVFP